MFADTLLSRPRGLREHRDQAWGRRGRPCSRRRSRSKPSARCRAI